MVVVANRGRADDAGTRQARELHGELAHTPAALCTSTTSPGTISMRCTSCSAVRPVSGTAAAVTRSTDSGAGASRRSGSTTCSAAVPCFTTSIRA